VRDALLEALYASDSNLRVLPIDTNRPPQRRRLPDQTFGTSAAKWQAIVEEVAAMHAVGRPVLA
jgi:preprotein translocase subunit SecA